MQSMPLQITEGGVQKHTYKCCARLRSFSPLSKTKLAAYSP